MYIYISGKLIIDMDVDITTPTNIRLGSGAEIVVGGDAALPLYPTLRIENCTLQSCVQMWRGITVMPNCRLVFKNNVIEDAEYAVSALASHAFNIVNLPTRIEIENNEFADNHVGIYLPQNVYWGNVWHYPIEGNLFTSTKLKAPTDVFLQNYEPTSGYAGILCIGTAASLTVGTPGTSGYSNTFRRIRNGVLSGNSTWLTVYRGNFENILGYYGTTGTPPNPNSSKGIAVLTDGGFSSVSGSDFDKCGHGIYANRSYFSVLNNRMPEVCVGIQANSPNGMYINTIGNPQQSIVFKDFGVLARNLYKWEFGNFRIENNNISDLLPVLNPDAGNTAILIDDANDPNMPDGRAAIAQNFIDLTSSFDAINVSNLNNWDIYENTIDLDLYALDHSRGISLTNAHASYLLNNIIAGTDINPMPNPGTEGSKAIYIGNSNEPDFCCNHTAGTVYGTEFFGPCESTVFRTTEMGNHYYSLKCSEATMLTDQPNLLVEPDGNYGNMFNTTSGTAQHDGGNGEVGDSEFNVKNNTQPHFPVVVSTPNSDNDWFYAVDNEPALCGECPAPPAPPRRGERIEDTDLHFVDGTYSGNRYGSMIAWEGQLRLYKQLLKTPSMLGLSAVIDSFFAAPQSAAIGNYHAVDVAVAEISILLEAINAGIRDAWEEVQANKTAVENQMAEIAFAATRADTVRVYFKTDSIRTAGLNDYRSFVEYWRIADSLRIVKANAALTLNEALTASNMLQSNRKTVNRIYLQTLAQGIYQLTDQQFEDVKDIANQCPLEGGTAVYKARSLYSLRENKAFNDNLLCPPPAEERRQKPMSGLKLNKDVLLIVPNPAREQIQVHLPVQLENSQKAIIKLVNANGQTVVHRSINAVNSVIPIDISQLTDGLYVCQVFADDLPLGSAKITIQH